MASTDYITSEEWFAWYPVKISGKFKWAWLKKVKRIINDCDLVYLGLNSRTFYEELTIKDK